MKQFITLDDLSDFNLAISEIKNLKDDFLKNKTLTKESGKTIGMIFFNPSLRTRLSTQKAAQNLGVKIMIMNFSNEAWALEFEDGTKMSGLRSEHIKEAAGVISEYCDIIAVRAFASLTDKTKDDSELIIKSFVKYSTVPVLNMESATAHPLQALADAVTIVENKQKPKPKVLLTWAPHPKSLPHAVGNSFVKAMQRMDVDFVIAQPNGFELNPEITKKTLISYNQKEALKEADFVYAKNWSSYSDYGKTSQDFNDWIVTEQKMKITNNAKFMHCLPIRRNIVASDKVLDGENSLVIKQAENRIYSAQYVIEKILSNG
jgi:N-succinyl-L-ornithine transcarbamylase